MSIKAMKQALDVLENTARSAVEQYVAEQKAITVLRQAIEQAERQEPDLPPVEIGVDVTEHGTTVVAFYRRPNAVMEMFYSQFHPQPKQPKNPSIRIQNHTHTNHPMRHWDRTCPACVADSESIANPIANHSETSGSPMPVAKYDSIELHVLHSHLAGMLFDFIGWLTSRRTRLCLSDSDNARPAVDAIVDFAKMRGLRLEDAQVKDWQAILTTPAQSQAEKQEPVAYLCENAVGHKYFRWKKPTSHYKPIALYTSPPHKKWVGLTDEEIWLKTRDINRDEKGWGIKFARAIESKLKEKNGG
jgi:hypothetical protein